MIFLVPQYGVGTVELLKEEEAHHLMVKGKLREGKFLCGSGIDRRREAVGTAYDSSLQSRKVQRILQM